jgi:beta-glucosidase
VIKKEVKNPDIELPINYTLLVQYLKEYRVGSIINTYGSTAQVDGQACALKSKLWQDIITLIHNTTRTETSLKIPVLYGVDSIHGATYIQEATLFPQGLSMAATFNLDLVERIGRITALETRAVGIPWNFNPVLDLGKQPLWPRFYETKGEDPYLGKKMGEAYVIGHQGDNNLTNRENAATCLKHFIGKNKFRYILLILSTFKTFC